MLSCIPVGIECREDPGATGLPTSIPGQRRHCKREHGALPGRTETTGRHGSKSWQPTFARNARDAQANQLSSAYGSTNQRPGRSLLIAGNRHPIRRAVGTSRCRLRHSRCASGYGQEGAGRRAPYDRTLVAFASPGAPRLSDRGSCVGGRGRSQQPHRRIGKDAVMPVGDTGDAILRHSALGQRQKPHDPKRAREDCGPSDGQSLPHLIPMSHAGSSSRTVLTNFSIETGFARNLSQLSSVGRLTGRTAAMKIAAVARPHRRPRRWPPWLSVANGSLGRLEKGQPCRLLQVFTLYSIGLRLEH